MTAATRAGLNRTGHPGIAESALQSIKLYILQNNLKAGDMLPPELELADLLGVSRPTLRETLRSLEALGIVRTVHGKGRFIRDFNYDAMVENLNYSLRIHMDDFREIIDVRMALEEKFLERAMDLLEQKDFRELERLVEGMEKQVAGGKPEEDLVQTHTEFHRKLYEKTGNKLLINLIGVFATFQRILSTMKRYRTGDYTQFIALHRELIDLLRSRDRSRIRETLNRHFVDVIRWSEEHREEEI